MFEGFWVLFNVLYSLEGIIVTVMFINIYLPLMQTNLNKKLYTVLYIFIRFPCEKNKKVQNDKNESLIADNKYLEDFDNSSTNENYFIN